MELKEAFKLVNAYIKEHHPFSSKNDRWDKEHGNKAFIYGFRHLEEYIEYMAEDDEEPTLIKEVETITYNGYILEVEQEYMVSNGEYFVNEEIGNRNLAKIKEAYERRVKDA